MSLPARLKPISLDREPCPEVSVVMPCLNEAETLETCLRKAQQALAGIGVCGEIVVADNGSTDGSQDIAFRCGARLVNVPEKGYGSALIGGIEAARGKYIIMGDADDSYEWAHIPRFLDSLRAGYELVMGNRFAGGIRDGAMPALHRYIGNPVLSAVGRVFFGSPVRDFHCGLRAFSRDAYNRMQLKSTGMEFASEMVVRATLLAMPITEVPTTLSPDGRSRPPHLRTWRDGWRHLRFLLLYSPRWLFLYPGLVLIVAAVVGAGALLAWQTAPGQSLSLYYTYVMVAFVLGFHAVACSVLAEVTGARKGLLPKTGLARAIDENVTLEKGLMTSGILILCGLLGIIVSRVWALPAGAGLALQLLSTFGSVTAVVIGGELGIASFLIAAIRIPES